MGQRVKRSAERTALIRATFVPSPAPDDLDALTEAYFSLSDEVNNSPPIIRDGDAHIGPLVVCYCQQCGARVAAAFVHDARGRGGTVVYRLDTQHPPADGAEYRSVPVVLSPGGDADNGRPPLRCGPTAYTHCRAHGRLTVKTATVLGKARKVVAQGDVGEPVKIQRVEAV